MKGLILKDLYNMRRYGRTMLLTLAFFALMMVGLEDAGFLSGMIVLMFTMMAITSFSYDDLAKWDRYALTLPVSRKDIVMGKYILALLLALMGTVISVAAGSAISFFKHIDYIEMLVSAYALLIVALVFISLLLPLIYKFGVEKTRVLLIAIVAVPTAAIMVLGQTGVALPGPDTIKLMLCASPVVIAAMLMLSYRISYRLFMKKDL